VGIADRFRIIVNGVATAANAARSAYRIATGKGAGTQPATIEADAKAMVQRVLRAGLAARNVAPVGTWKPFSGNHPESKQAAAVVVQPESKYDQIFTGVGQDLYAYSFANLSEITLGSIADYHRRATVQGWTDRKADLDSRFVREDSHVRGLDAIRRSRLATSPFRIAPSSSRPLAILVANAVREAFSKIENFRSTCSELGVFGMSGYAVGELVWREDVTLHVPIGRGSVAIQGCEVIRKIAPIPPRALAFDIVDDSPWLVLGPGLHVPVDDSDKFLYIRGDGPASLPTRFRGWGWANAWLSYLAALPLERLSVVVETFGIPTPYLERSDSRALTDVENLEALELLEAVGTGRPAMIPRSLGTLEHSPVPQGLAPLHAQMLAIVRSEQSKNILSSTLQTEIGGNGSYAAATVHEGQETKIVRLDSVVLCEALTRTLRHICAANAERWAAAFARFVPGITPADIVEAAPFCSMTISDETPSQRVQVFTSAKALGVELDTEQVREELQLRAPLPMLTFGDAEPRRAECSAPSTQAETGTPALASEGNDDANP